MTGLRSLPNPTPADQTQFAKYLQDKLAERELAATQPRVFGSAIAALYDPYGVELERKRRQQERLAETLRKQIEDKRKAKESETQRLAERASRAAVADQATQLLSNMRGREDGQVEDDAAKIDAPAAPLVKPRMVLSIKVSTESPFTHSQVDTPPLGFSLRRVAPVKNAGPAYSSMERTWPRNPGPNGMIARRLLNDSQFAIGRRDADLQEGTRLRTNSELVYPDGHVSPVSSPM
jgi:hypothetical protein